MSRFVLRRLLPAIAVLMIFIVGGGHQAFADGPTPDQKGLPIRPVTAIQQGNDLTIKGDKQDRGHITFQLSNPNQPVNILRTQFNQGACRPEVNWPLNMQGSDVGDILISPQTITMSYTPAHDPNAPPISGSLTWQFDCLRWGEPVTPEIEARIYYVRPGVNQVYYVPIRFYFGP